MPSRLITDCHPVLQPLAREFLDRCKVLEVRAFITCTYRSNAEQDQAYAQGRTKNKGTHIITNARGGESPHNCTLHNDGVTPGARAFDFAIYLGDQGQELDWDADDDDWKNAIAVGEALGLVSGSTFSFKDYAHMELRNWKSF